MAALIGAGGSSGGGILEEKVEPMDTLDGIPLGEDRVLDFELSDDLDGQPMVRVQCDHEYHCVVAAV